MNPNCAGCCASWNDEQPDIKPNRKPTINESNTIARGDCSGGGGGGGGGGGKANDDVCLMCG